MLSNKFAEQKYVVLNLIYKESYNWKNVRKLLHHVVRLGVMRAAWCDSDLMNLYHLFLSLADTSPFYSVKLNHLCAFSLNYSRRWPRVPLTLGCTAILIFGMNYMTPRLPKKVGAIFPLVVN